MNLAIATLLSLNFMVTATEDVKGFEEHTITYTGGPYKEEVFKYRLLKPANIEAGKTYPVILFLHGAGERGDDNVSQLKYLPEWMSGEYREKYPCFVIAPQCRRDQKWSNVSWGDKNSTPLPEEASDNMKVAIAALDELEAKYPVDKTREYLTGLSMGGYGSWDLAVRYPKRFAAVAPVCGGGDSSKASLLVGLPIYCYHGDADGAVPVERSRQMIAAIKAAGGDPKYKELAGVGHDSWNAAYHDADGVIPWMFEQHLPAANGK